MEHEYGKFNERGVYRTPEDLEIIHKNRRQLLSLHLRTLLVVTVISALLAVINHVFGRKPFVYNLCLAIMSFGLMYGFLNIISQLFQYRVDPEDQESIMYWNVFDSLQRTISALFSSIVYMFLQEMDPSIYLRKWGRAAVIAVFFVTLEKGLVTYLKIRHHRIYFKERIDENLRAMATINRIRVAFPSSKDNISIHSILSSDSLAKQLRDNKRIRSARKVSNMRSPLQEDCSSFMDAKCQVIPDEKTEAKTKMITDDNIINTITDAVSWVLNGSARILNQVISGKALIDDDYDEIKASFETDVDSNDILEVSGNSAIHEICSNIFNGLLNASKDPTALRRDCLIKEDFFSVLRPEDAVTFLRNLTMTRMVI